MDNPYGYEGEAYRAYRKLVRSHGKVAVHKLIDGAKNPEAGLVLAVWTLLQA